MPTPDSRTSPDPAIAGRVSGCVRITDVRLNRVFFQAGLGVDEAFVESLRTEYYADVASFESGLLVLAVGFRLHPHPERNEGQGPEEQPQIEEETAGTDEEPPPLLAFVDYLLFYEVDEDADFSREELEHFARINGVFNAWAYWRSKVQAVFAEMGLPRMIIEPFRVPMMAQTRVDELASADH